MAFKKDPDAVLDYSVDWSPWLVEGDYIVSVEWVPSAGVTVGDVAPYLPTHTNTTATAWVFGGVLDADEFVICRITTFAGRVEDRTIRLLMVER